MLTQFFRPALLKHLDGYNRTTFQADLSAGITVGIVALPLAMAFAIASGVTPQAGIFTAIIAGFLISMFGGSRVQIGGPTGAYIVIVYGIVSEYGLANLMLCTIASGVLLFTMGAMRLGGLIRFIPVCIVIGFTNGIAVLIMLSQLKDFLGLTVTLPDEFFTKLRVIAQSLDQTNWQAVILSAVCVLAIWFWPKRILTSGDVLKAQEDKRPSEKLGSVGVFKVTRFVLDKTVTHTARSRQLLMRVPAPIGVLIIASLIVALLAPLGMSVETIGSRFSDGIPQGFPEFQWPEISLETLRKLAAPTMTIALLGAIESLLSARVADAQTDDRHDPNQELMGQGIANIVTPFFGGIPATGAIARTATNIRAGGKTPIAGMIHALTLLAIVLVAAPLASYIPLAALCAILIVVAINMGDWHAFREMRRFSLQYRVILLTTFFVTVVFDLTLAVEIGLTLSALFYIFRASNLTRIERLPLDSAPPRVSAYKLRGSLFFGAVGKIEPLMDPRINTSIFIVLDIQQVLDIDATGMDSLLSLNKTLKKRGGYLVLCAPGETVLSDMERTGFTEELGRENLVPDLATALERIRGIP
ncbi:MAG: STAS domain-containing protein [Burkholderiales bacterium]|jgi:SulP family sulfate permease|nr:STAS domain-containing protein [Burkholderiales bacterium]